MECLIGDFLNIMWRQKIDSESQLFHPIILKPLFFSLLQVADYFNAYSSDVLTIFDKVLHRTAMEFSEKTYPEQSTHDIMRCFLHTRITGEDVIPQDESWPFSFVTNL